jgi:hypothetical protein
MDVFFIQRVDYDEENDSVTESTDIYIEKEILTILKENIVKDGNIVDTEVFIESRFKDFPFYLKFIDNPG